MKRTKKRKTIWRGWGFVGDVIIPTHPHLDRPNLELLGERLGIDPGKHEVGEITFGGGSGGTKTIRINVGTRDITITAKNVEDERAESSSLNTLITVAQLGESDVEICCPLLGGRRVAPEDELDQFGITCHTFLMSGETGRTVIIPSSTTHGRRSRIFCHKVMTKGIPDSIRKDIKQRILGGQPDFIICAGIRRPELTLVGSIFTVTKAHTVFVPNTSILKPMDEDERRQLQRIMALSRTVSMNDSEVGDFLGLRSDFSPERDLPRLLAKIQTGAREVEKAMMTETLIVTMGERGSSAMDVASGKTAEEPALTVDALDTTGCGDALLGGFLVARNHGLSLALALRTGAVVAARNLQHLGGHGGMLDKQGLWDWLKRNEIPFAV